MHRDLILKWFAAGPCTEIPQASLTTLVFFGNKNFLKSILDLNITDSKCTNKSGAHNHSTLSKSLNEFDFFSKSILGI